MNQAANLNQTLNNDYALLTEENRKKVIEMTKFLVLTQNTIVPELLNLEKIHVSNEEE